MLYLYNGAEIPRERLAERLASDGLPICPGEIDNARAVPYMLAELEELGYLECVGPDAFRSLIAA